MNPRGTNNANNPRHARGNVAQGAQSYHDNMKHGNPRHARPGDAPANVNSPRANRSGAAQAANQAANQYGAGQRQYGANTNYNRPPQNYAARNQGFPNQRGFQQQQGYPRNVAQTVDYAPAMQANGQFSNFGIPTKKKMSKRKKTLIILGIIIGIILAAVFAYSMMLNNALSKNSDDDFVSKPTDYNSPFYMLLLGSDSREYSGTSDRADESGDNERSDVMLLARMDLKNRQVDLISVPRDTPWTDSDGNLCKINEAYNQGGASLSVQAVESLTGVSISHYADIKVSQLEGLVDSIGGVVVDVDTDMSVKDTLTGETIELKAGTQLLNGKQAQAFARTRKTYSGNQDQHRQSNVRQLIEAIAEKIVSGNPVEIPGNVLAAANYVGTDLRSDSLIAMTAAYGSGSGKLNMKSWTGPYNGAIESSTQKWLCYKNEAGWQNLIKEVEAGGSQSNLNFDATQTVW